MGIVYSDTNFQDILYIQILDVGLVLHLFVWMGLLRRCKPVLQIDHLISPTRGARASEMADKSLK